jgi:malate synthase
MAKVGNLEISDDLYELVKNEIAPDTGIDADDFFTSMESIITDLEPKNRELLNKRDELQRRIDEWFAGQGEFSASAYEEFLKEIGYIVPEGEDFQVETQNIDPEIAEIAGPQLVVPVDNPRFALNAANARWGSLYNALYGDPRFNNIIDANGGRSFTDGYNPERGLAVITKANEFLDQIFPLKEGSWNDIESVSGENLKNSEQYVGYTDNSILLKNNGLHVEIQIDPESEIGKQSKAGIKDVILESALTTIQDCEDSVASVDAEDKVRVYRDWNGLMKGTLEDSFKKGGKVVSRKLNPDRVFSAPDGGELTLSGRSMLLVRNAGIHLYTPAVKLNGQETPEGFIDAMVTTLAAMHDFKSKNNSKVGSIYIVKPKQHGPEEVAATVELFGRVEKALGLPENTMKIGIMDEEQRTSVNLKECVRMAKERVIFINTGFLDRTGDLMHTGMAAGIFDTKPNMQKGVWLQAYEKNNVQVGLETGLYKVGQIGKGMWAQNRNSAGLLEIKIGHLQAGADCAWVPSPTFATLHAMHYHQCFVRSVQEELLEIGNPQINKQEILNLPLMQGELEQGEKLKLLDSYTQSILGYVVRWVDSGVGCSSVPDIDDVYLMEDCATLRIGSQLLANWLKHGVITKEELNTSFEKMAAKVDEQNAGDTGYTPMVGNFDGIAFQTSLKLVFEGEKAPNGYVEHSLYEGRKAVKSQKKLADIA